MKHEGKARRAAMRIILWSFVLFIILLSISSLASPLLGGARPYVLGAWVACWLIFAGFAWSFFRDPEAQSPAEFEVIVSPAHGKVDVIDETEELEFIGGRCKRISIFLSVFDVHVQNAPIAGVVTRLKHCPGQFLNAMRSDCASVNENVLAGFESSEVKGEKIAVRLIAGLIARRIVPWISEGDQVARGERISLIQFGSRVDLLLPLEAEIRVKIGDRVTGGETVVAKRTVKHVQAN